MTNFRFRDLVEIPALQKLTDDLYTATGIPSAIIDMEGVVLTGSGWQRICTEFHRKNPAITADCIASDTAIRSGIKNGEQFVIYECPRGLVDACSPVIIDGEHVANVFAGQLFMETPGAEKEEFFRRTAREYGFPEEEYLAAYREVPVLAEERFRPALRFLSGFAELVAQMGLARKRELAASDRFLQVAAATSEMIWEIDSKGLYTYISPGVGKLLGYSPEEIVGKKHFYELHPEEGREEFKNAAFALFARKQSIKRLLNPLATKEGAVLWVETTGTPLLDKRGSLLGYRGVDADVTAKVAQEEERERSRKRVETIIKTAMDGFWISNMEGRILQVNDAYCRMSGYTEAELVGKPIADLEAVESPAEIRARIQMLIADGGGRFETVHRAKNGGLFDVEMSIKYQDWDAGRCVAFIRDITERKKAEAELSEREQRYHALFDSSLDAVMLTDPSKGRIYEINEAGCRLFGRTREEILSCGRTDLVDADDPRLKLALEERDRTGRFQGELRLLRGDGTKIPADVSTSVFHTATGELRTAMIIRDITERKRAEELLRESEEKFSKAFRNAPLMFVITDLETGRYLDVNEEISRVSGFAREEIVGHTAAELGWNTPENLAKILAELAAKGRISGLELTLQARDGHPLSCIMSGERVTIGGRECLLTTTVDISERKELIERYRLLVESLPDIVYQYSARNAGVFYSPQVRKVLGYTPEHLVKNPKLWHDSIHPEDVSLVDEAIRKAGETDRIEVTYRIKDAKGEWRWLHDRSARITKDTGDVTIFGIASDITEIKRVDEALRRYEMLAEHSRDIILFIELESGLILEANAAAVAAYGYSRDEILNLRISDLRAPATRSLAKEQMAEALKHGTMFETVHQRKDGSTFPVEVSSKGLMAGQVHTLISVIRDISERRKNEAENQLLQERLAQSQKMEAIGTLAGGIAHDFNNILGAIMGYTELSLAQVPLESELSDNLHDVLSASQRAKTLVQQILAFGRRGEKKVIQVDAADLVGEAMKLLVSVIPKTITIERELDQGAGSVMADPTELHQVVMNLCTNAYQAMSETGGVMRVKVASGTVDHSEASHLQNLTPGEYVKIEVSDSGPGMDEKTLARIFEPYFTTKPQSKGTGLGLALVHGIVAALNGAIRVRSTPGAGSVFTVYLPRLETSAPLAQKRTETLNAHGKGIVLLVDDEPALARLGRKMLESLGYTVREFTDPQEALRHFESDPDAIDVIVTDQTMPGLTGAEMLCRAKVLRPRMPSVMCTGYSDLIDEEGAIEQGINAFVQKPYDKLRLGQAVAQALGGG